MVHRLLATSILAGVLQVQPTHAQSGVWTHVNGGSWALPGNWLDGVVATGTDNTSDFSTLTLSGSPTVTLDGAQSVGKLIFGDLGNAYGWTMLSGSGGPLTLAVSSGSPTIMVNGETTTLDLALAGTQGFTKEGEGTLVLAGVSTYAGATTISAGTLALSGSSSGGTPTSSLLVGGAVGRGVLNFNGSGTWTFATSSGKVFVGGNGGGGDTGAGAVNQSAGTLNFGNATYITLGAGGNSYGSYHLSGGTLNTINSSGFRIGFGGLGSYVQTAGVLNCGRYFAIGGSSPTGNGVATFTGGTATIASGYRMLIPDTGGATAVLNLGTEAGGTAFITHLSTTGVVLQNNAGANGTLNLNSGTLRLGGPIFRNNASDGSAVLNLNGGTLQAGANNVTLIRDTPMNVNVYNKGVTFDSQGYTATVAANLLSATGHGIYPSGGILNIESGGGSGYLGAPLVAISGGAGSGAMAIANINGGVVTGVTLTCPGMNYVAGDTLSFEFVGGGATIPANTFNYSLTAGDLAPNSLGGLTKLGSGTLILNAASTYPGNTSVGAGTLDVRADGGLGQGTVAVAGGAVLTLGGGETNGYIYSAANLALDSLATANLNYAGANTINGLSLDGGLTYVATGTWGAIGSGATHEDSHFNGTGLIQVTGRPAGGVAVVLTTSPNPSVAGQPVTFIATATGSMATPTGTVTFMDGTMVLGASSLNGSGVASWTTSFPVSASHSITARYGGNGSYASATSLPLIQIVNPPEATWTGAKNEVWDVNATTNWVNLGLPAKYHNGDVVQFDDRATGGTDIALAVMVSPNHVIFANNAKNYSLSGAGAITGGAGLAKNGTGTLTVSNANSYTGLTSIENGTVTFGGTGSSSGNGGLNVGNGAGRAVLSLSSTGSLAFSDYISLGGIAGNSSDIGSGAITQSAGTLSIGSGATYLELGTGGAGTYGYYHLAGGALNMVNASGVRIGASGLGVFLQTDGSLNCSRWFAIGSGTGPNGIGGGAGVATFTGGSATISASYRILVGDKAGSTGVLNLGTLAGGSATLTAPYSSDGNGGVALLWGSGANSAVVNLNRGTLQLAGPIYQNLAASGAASLNLNGGTIQASASDISLIDASVGNVIVFNGGVVIDTQTNNVLTAANLQSATGNGIYPVGGKLPIGSGGGSGYIGAPLVAVSGGSGSGATAIANLSGGVVTGVALTCPGQGYEVGDQVSFEFSGGAALVPADTFTYNLKAVDVAPNSAGGLTKIGPGTLTLGGSSTYAGSTLVSNGALAVDGSIGGAAVTVTGGRLSGSGLIASPVNIQTGGTLAPGSTSIGQLNISSTLSLAGTVSLRLDKTGNFLTSDSLQGLTSVTYGGTLSVTDITSDGTLLAAGDQLTLFASSAYSGRFSVVSLPPLSVGLRWNISNLAVNGSIQVEAGVSTTPTTITNVVRSGVLNLSWPSDHTGWQLQVQTNHLAAGVSQDTNDWAIIVGSSLTNQVFLPLDPAKRTEFFRLVYP
jgi:autotransporter-associated beta strand protein